jgi:hypothetical protein
MREKLRSMSGKKVTVTAEYIYEDIELGRGHLVRHVQDSEGQYVADHLWLRVARVDGYDPKNGDLVIIHGEVTKYGALQFKGGVREDYDIKFATIKKQKGF